MNNQIRWLWFLSLNHFWSLQTCYSESNRVIAKNILLMASTEYIDHMNCSDSIQFKLSNYFWGTRCGPSTGLDTVGYSNNAQRQMSWRISQAWHRDRLIMNDIFPYKHWVIGSKCHGRSEEGEVNSNQGSWKVFLGESEILARNKETCTSPLLVVGNQI